MLGAAPPVETEPLDVLPPLDDALIGLGARLAVVRPRRHRPLGRQGSRGSIASRLEERDLHAGRRDAPSFGSARMSWRISWRCCQREGARYNWCRPPA